MKSKTLLIFACIAICLALFLSSCKPVPEPEPPVYTSVCGDGVCSANEIRECDIDCNLNLEQEPSIKTSQDIIEELKSNRKVYTPEERLEMGGNVVESDEKILVESFASYLPETGFSVASRYNLLSIGENITDVMGVLHKFHLREILKGGRLSTNTEAFGPRAAMYEQLLTLRAGKVEFGVDEESDMISTYLFFKEKEPILDYLMELNGGIFKFFEGETIDFLGHEYFIQEVTNSSMRFTGVTTPDELFFRNERGVWINGKTVSNEVLNVSFGHDYLRIMLITEDEIKILPGTGLRDYLLRPEVMLTNRLDIVYEGLTEVPVFDIEFDMKGDKYKLSFTTNKNNTYNVPFAYINPVKMGDDDNSFVFKEGEGKEDYVIKEKDYFIIGNNKEYNGLTNILRLVSIGDKLIHFEDPALEKFYVYYEGIPGINATADLIIDNVLHKVYIGENEAISVDLDGNGRIGKDKVPIVTAGNGIIKINSADNEEINVSLITPKQMRENENTDLEINIIIDKDGLRVDKKDIVLLRIQGTDNMIGMTNYGALLLLKDYTSAGKQTGEDLIIKYPIIQRFADVVVKGYE